MSCRFLSCIFFLSSICLCTSNVHHSKQKRYIKYKPYSACNITLEELPMWSWGFARVCCDVYPDKLGSKERSFFEHGDLSDKNYFVKHNISTGDAVYVATADFPLFLDTFMRLPKSSRIVLVSGAEDIGTPYELFNPNRPNFFDYRMSALWPVGQKMTMREFISDPRLHRWFVQNYDLVGCNPYTCSNISDRDNAYLVPKVVPMPIGLDLHSRGEKRHSGNYHVSSVLCDQISDLKHAQVQSKSIPFSKKKVAALAAFGCDFDNTRLGTARKRTRGDLCSLIRSHGSGGDGAQVAIDFNLSTPTLIEARKPAAVKPSNARRGKAAARLGFSEQDSALEARLDFWARLSQYSFAIAPAGFGLDTHRVWEILNIGVVPIVLQSTLDSLYSQFPCIILKKWSDLLAPGALASFKNQIMKKFGAEPFSDAIQWKLSADYWVQLVHAAKSEIRTGAAAAKAMVVPP